NLLKSQNEQKALDDFIEDFRNKYKDETQCADDYIVEDCDNADDEQTATGPASGGSPQVAPPQGGAPQGQPVPVPQGGAPQGQPVPVPQGGAPQGTPVPVPQ